MRSADDIVVVRPPSWWSPRRLLVTLTTVGAVLAGSIAWAVALRRQVALQVTRLAGEIEKRREAAIEFRAALAERSRLANSLHDTLLQGLASAVLQLDSCRFAIQSGRADAAERQLEKSKRMVQHAVNDLQNSVWALRVAPLEGRTFGESLATMADRIALADTPRIAVHAAETMDDLPKFVAGNLLLVAQEAIRNVVNHAECATVDIGLVGDPATRTVTLTVRNDGRGFDPAAAAATTQAHFGLVVMQERMERIGGAARDRLHPGPRHDGHRNDLARGGVMPRICSAADLFRNARRWMAPFQSPEPLGWRPVCRRGVAATPFSTVASLCSDPPVER